MENSLRQIAFCFQSRHRPLDSDGALVQKIQNSIFFNCFSTNMVDRGVQSFCILEGATDPLIEQ